MIDQTERDIVTTNMIEYGGSFIKRLGKAIRAADPVNYKKLKNTFPVHWKKYYNDRQYMNETHNEMYKENAEE